MSAGDGSPAGQAVRFRYPLRSKLLLYVMIGVGLVFGAFTLQAIPQPGTAAVDAAAAVFFCVTLVGLPLLLLRLFPVLTVDQAGITAVTHGGLFRTVVAWADIVSVNYEQAGAGVRGARTPELYRLCRSGKPSFRRPNLIVTAQLRDFESFRAILLREAARRAIPVEDPWRLQHPSGG